MSKVLPQFGPYEALRRLGAGGMAETFVALRRGPHGFVQKVCIKRILPAYAENSDFTQSFLREARTSAVLRHANIVQVLDFGQVDDSYYLALELIEGLDLRALLAGAPRSVTEDASPRTLSAEIVTLIAGELSAALEHAHGEGYDREPVVHRDLSPSNVLVSPAGEVKLTDFGIARALGGAQLTATGVIKGKVPYLPPEYIERGVFDQRSDLFSLGVLLFELLAGERPFDGESDLDTIRRIASGERPQLRDLAPHVPRALAECVERLIAGAPSERFDSARALLDALPPISTHAARRELGALVEARMRILERASGRISARVPAPTAPASAQAPLEDDPGEAPTLSAPAPFHARPATAQRAAVVTRTRKSVPPARDRSWKRKLIAMGLAAAALSAFSLGALLKGQGTVAADGTSTSIRTTPEGSGPPQHAPEVSAPPQDQKSAALAPAPVAPSAPEPPPSSVPVSTPPAAPAEAPKSAARANAPAEVRVFVHPFGEVWIDGKPLGHAPVSVKLPSGTHEIGVGDGRPEQHRTVQVRAGQHKKVVFRRALEPR